MDVAAALLTEVICDVFDREASRGQNKALILNFEVPNPPDLVGITRNQILIYAPSTIVGVYCRSYHQRIHIDDTREIDGVMLPAPGKSYDQHSTDWEFFDGDHVHTIYEAIRFMDAGKFERQEGRWYRIVTVDDNMSKELWEARNGGTLDPDPTDDVCRCDSPGSFCNPHARPVPIPKGHPLFDIEPEGDAA